MFEDLFTLCFDVHLDILTPYSLASRYLGEGRESVIDEIEPTIFV